MSELRDKIKEILRSMDLGYPYQMSDYATSREQELEYEREGLQEVNDIADQLMQLIQAERTKAKEEVVRVMDKLMMQSCSNGIEQVQGKDLSVPLYHYLVLKELKQSLATEKGIDE